MVIDMDETRLRTIEQLADFLRATPEVAFTAPVMGGAGDNQRYEHISRVLARFDYPRCNKRERGVVLAYLRRTSGYGRAQLTRLVRSAVLGWINSKPRTLHGARSMLSFALRKLHIGWWRPNKLPATCAPGGYSQPARKPVAQAAAPQSS
jgi:hypothetical protein